MTRPRVWRRPSLQACGHRTEVVPEGVDYYCVNVHKGDCQTFTLYDPADWMWLREQILAP